MAELCLGLAWLLWSITATMERGRRAVGQLYCDTPHPLPSRLVVFILYKPWPCNHMCVGVCASVCVCVLCLSMPVRSFFTVVQVFIIRLSLALSSNCLLTSVLFPSRGTWCIRARPTGSQNQGPASNLTQASILRVGCDDRLQCVRATALTRLATHDPFWASFVHISQRRTTLRGPVLDRN
ncbi:hypothetical protein V8C42DRAFT_331154 [Trichoderma barbatum]